MDEKSLESRRTDVKLIEITYKDGDINKAMDSILRIMRETPHSDVAKVMAWRSGDINTVMLSIPHDGIWKEGETK